MLRQDLDRDRVFQPRVSGFTDFTHSARPDRRYHVPRAELIAYTKWHLGSVSDPGRDSTAQRIVPLRLRTVGELGERLLWQFMRQIAVLSYLDRLLDPLTDTLTPESAAALLALRADTEIEARIDELRRKANEGSLTPSEDAEYRDFIEAVDVISIMQAKARRSLSRQAT